MELEIAGLMDRPSVDLPIPRKLQRLHEYQDRLKNFETDICSVQAYDTCEGPIGYFGDIVVSLEKSDSSTEPSMEGGHGEVHSYDTVKVGHVSPTANNQLDIVWWTFRLSHPATRFHVDLSGNLLLVYLRDRMLVDNMEFEPYVLLLLYPFD